MPKLFPDPTAELTLIGPATARLAIRSEDGIRWGNKEDVRGTLYRLTISNQSGEQPSLVLIPQKPFVQDKTGSYGLSWLWVRKEELIEWPDGVEL